VAHTLAYYCTSDTVIKLYIVQGTGYRVQGREVEGFNLPVVVFEPRPPVGCLEKGLESAGQVDKSVAHQEEHGQERSNLVNVA